MNEIKAERSFSHVSMCSYYDNILTKEHFFEKKPFVVPKYFLSEN